MRHRVPPSRKQGIITDHSRLFCSECPERVLETEIQEDAPFACAWANTRFLTSVLKTLPSSDFTEGRIQVPSGCRCSVCV